MKKLFLAFLALPLLFGCNTGNSSSYTGYALDKEYAGQPVQNFFHEYGFPEARFARADGSVEYVWASTGLKVYPSQEKPDTYYSDKGIYQVVDTWRSKKQWQYCELRIFTDKAELIRSIDIAVDTSGKWSESRCSEIF